MFEKSTPEQRELRAVKVARVEDARQRMFDLVALKAQVEARIEDAQRALRKAEADL